MILFRIPIEVMSFHGTVPDKKAKRVTPKAHRSTYTPDSFPLSDSRLTKTYLLIFSHDLG